MDDSSTAATLPPQARRLLKAHDIARAVARLYYLPRFAFTILLVAGIWVLAQPFLARTPAHFAGLQGPGGSIEPPPHGQPNGRPNPALRQPLDVAVNPIGHCEQPPCDVSFEARVLGAKPETVNLTWSGCAHGAAPISSCPVDEQRAVVATVTAVSKVTGERVTASATAAPRMVTVFYGTDRRPEPRSDGAVGFGGARNTDPLQPLSLGISTVAIPPGHRRAEIERPLKIWKIERQEDVREHIVILDASPRTPEAFFADLHSRVGESATNDAFIFVHGFRVGFDDAVRQTGQLAWDLKFSGVPILYSWTSGGALAAYGTDYDSARLSRVNFAQFLRDVQQRSGARTLYLIAHSMGSWAVVNGLEEMARTPAGPGAPHLKELIFAAPDVDQTEFRIAAPRMKRWADRITLYAASEDTALKASTTLRSDYPRAGQGGDDKLLLLPDVDTIDASAVVNESTSLLNHSYFSNTLSVLGDISTILRSGTPADQRFGLETHRRDGIAYWLFVAGGYPYWVLRAGEYGLILAGLFGLLFVLARPLQRFFARRLAAYGYIPRTEHL